MANPTITPIMPPASGPGNPLANPIYLVDQYGNPVSAESQANGVALNTIQEMSVALYNGTSLDLQRGNLDTITVMNISAATTTQTSADQTNYNARGVYVVVKVTTLTGTTPTLTPSIQGKGPVAGSYFALHAAFTAINATGTFIYLIYPSAPTAAGGVTGSGGFPLPRTWNVVMTAGGTITNATYTVEAIYIL